MKILDRYILSSYLKTFISVFVILMLIFVLQAIWLYIKELAGKDLDPATIVKFLFYITPTLIPLILPLTILLSSIMVFGNFAENYEFAAMKSTGISLQRAMSGLSVFIVALGITTFFFSNNVIPWAQYESFNLRKNIAKVKPAMAIAEGQFNQIVEGFNIKVYKKTGKRGQFLETIVIHKGQKSKPGNYTTIIAKKGELVSAEKSDVLKLILYDGYYYDDTPPKEYKERIKKPFVKSVFDNYTMNIDLSQLNKVDLDEKSIDNKYSMLSISQLNYTTDSLYTERQKSYSVFSNTLHKRTNISTLNLTVKTKKDTTYTGEILDLFKTNRKVQLLDYAINAVSSTDQIIGSIEVNLKAKTIWLNKHIIALHEKFALAFACVILFFVGAPLGALIRKGGLGLPMVIAIVLFLTYHFIGIFAKNSAKDGSLNPVFATWFSTLIMLPLSIFLTRRATSDRGIFEFDHITEPIKAFFKKTPKYNDHGEKMLSPEDYDDIRRKEQTRDYRNLRKEYKVFKNYFIIKNLEYDSISSSLYKLIEEFKFDRIEINVQKEESSTYLFDFNDTVSNNEINEFIHAINNETNIPLEIINESHVNVEVTSNDFIHYFSIIKNPNYNKVESEEKIKTTAADKERKSLLKAALITFILAVILLILHFVFANNKLPQFASATIQLSPILGIVSLFYFIKSKMAN